MTSRRCSQSEHTPGSNLRSCGCARRYPTSSPSPPVNGGPGNSRSSTASSAGFSRRGLKQRSRTPSNVSSGRTTPSPTRNPRNNTIGLGERAASESALHDWEYTPAAPSKFSSTLDLKQKGFSAHHTTSVLIRIGSTKRHHIEELKYEVKLTPRNTTEAKMKEELKRQKGQRFRTELEVKLEQADGTSVKVKSNSSPEITVGFEHCKGKGKFTKQGEECPDPSQK